MNGYSLTTEACGKEIFIRRHFSDGSAGVCRCLIRRLTPEDYSAALTLHDEVSHGLSREIFAASSPADIARFLSDEACAVGVWREKKLVALRTIKLSDAWTAEALKDYGLAGDCGEKPAVTGFCVVDWEFRGNNVQFLTYYMSEELVSRSHDSLFTTVSPKNIFSLENILKCNFRIIGINKVYGGYLRFILKKDFRPTLAPLWTHGHEQIPIRDKKRQLDALANGYAGYRLVRKPSGFHILYAQVSRVLFLKR